MKNNVIKHIIWVLLLTLILSFIFGYIDENNYKNNPDYAYKEITKIEPKVYVTNTGYYYHDFSCGSLYNSAIAKGRNQAYEEGYLACSKCAGKPNGTITVTYTVKEPVPYGIKHIMGSIALAILTACFTYGNIRIIYEVYFADKFETKKKKTPSPEVTPTKPTPEPDNNLTARELLIKIMQNFDDDTINSFTGKTVHHNSFGNGIITLITNKRYIEVYFLDIGETKKFIYPDAFADKYLSPVNFKITINKDILNKL